SFGPGNRVNDRDAPANECVGQVRQPIISALRPARFDREVVALPVARFVQAKAERLQERRIRLGELATQNANDGHRRLLRARYPRPRDGRAAEERNELAPLHPLDPTPKDHWEYR